jgi:hypothetical protein
MPNELPIPPEALTHRSVEMIRVWLANEQQHVVLNVGFWEDRGLDERSAWGIVIADMIRHIANAHVSEYGHDRIKTVAMICRALIVELENPTSGSLGEFVKAKAAETAPKRKKKRTGTTQSVAKRRAARRKPAG